MKKLLAIGATLLNLFLLYKIYELAGFWRTLLFVVCLAISIGLMIRAENRRTH